MRKLISLKCVNYIYLSLIDIINKMCIMYRFYTYYKYIIIIVIFYLFSLKLQKWFSQEQCAMINMNADRTNIGTLPL